MKEIWQRRRKDSFGVWYLSDKDKAEYCIWSGQLFHGFSSIDEEFYEELEEILIMGDLGVKATYAILDDLREKVKEQHIKEPADCKQLLIDSIKAQMQIGETAYEFENRKSVVLVIGVNGVGKTTTIGKLAGKLRSDGKKVVIAAADTFRAAAGDQLKEWADRANAEFIGGQEGSDPAAVVYDAVAAAKARKADVLLCDTAGRLHNKKNLMEELKKINRIIDREYPDAYRETLVVLDGTTGQNALLRPDSLWRWPISRASSLQSWMERPRAVSLWRCRQSSASRSNMWVWASTLRICRSFRRMSLWTRCFM